MLVKIKKFTEGSADENYGEIEIDMNDLGHEICMGIRHGLFGASAEQNEDVSIALDTFNISDSIEKVAGALYRIADALYTISGKEEIKIKK